MAAVATQLELDAANTLGQVLDWAQVTGDPNVVDNMRGAFLRATGATEEALPRVFGVLPAVDFDNVMNQISISGGTLEAPTSTPLNLFQRGALVNVGLFCRLKTGLLVAPPGATVAVLPPPSPAMIPTMPGAKVKLSLICKQGDDTEVFLVDDSLFSIGYARWEKLFGVNLRPGPEAECTSAQLSCLKHLVDTLQAPAVDFALWGPHGIRLERKLRLAGAVFDNDGNIIMIEIAGPPTIAVWLLSWEVFATGCIMLDIVDLGVLLAYRTHIVSLHSRYGPQAWLLLYQADSRFRFEHMLRTKRFLADAHVKVVAAGGTTEYVQARPWSMAMAMGLKDADWWRHEFTENAMMVLARTSSMEALVSYDAPVQAVPGRNQVAPHIGQHSHAADTTTAVKAPKRKKEDLAKIVGSEYVSNRAGCSLCTAFQTGACGQSPGNALCPQDRSKRHQCCLCLDNSHGKTTCNRSGSVPFVKKLKGSKGGGKGSKGKGKSKW